MLPLTHFVGYLLTDLGIQLINQVDVKCLVIVYSLARVEQYFVWLRVQFVARFVSCKRLS